ncbi:hypothetical protein CLOP_g302 [Closterium sp. NIES-67]|nr:hypothetical protein CLOP_g302 [Closterium sp. NIES-67]
MAESSESKVGRSSRRGGSGISSRSTSSGDGGGGGGGGGGGDCSSSSKAVASKARSGGGATRKPWRPAPTALHLHHFVAAAAAAAAAPAVPAPPTPPLHESARSVARGRGRGSPDGAFREGEGRGGKMEHAGDGRRGTGGEGRLGGGGRGGGVGRGAVGGRGGGSDDAGACAVSPAGTRQGVRGVDGGNGVDGAAGRGTAEGAAARRGAERAVGGAGRVAVNPATSETIAARRGKERAAPKKKRASRVKRLVLQARRGREGEDAAEGEGEDEARGEKHEMAWHAVGWAGKQEAGRGGEDGEGERTKWACKKGEEREEDVEDREEDVEDREEEEEWQRAEQQERAAEGLVEEAGEWGEAWADGEGEEARRGEDATCERLEGGPESQRVSGAQASRGGMGRRQHDDVARDGRRTGGGRSGGGAREGVREERHEARDGREKSKEQGRLEGRQADGKRVGRRKEGGEEGRGNTQGECMRLEQQAANETSVRDEASSVGDGVVKGEAEEEKTEEEEGGQEEDEGEAKGGQEGSAGQRRGHPTTFVRVDASIRYSQQVVTPEVNALVLELLAALLRFQHRALQRDPLKAAMRRRLLCGLREVGKAVRTGRAKCVVLAPNVEEVLGEGGLDAALASIVAEAAGRSIPVVMALSTRRLAKALNRPRCRMSAVAILDSDGAHSVLKSVLAEAERGRAMWRAVHGGMGERLAHGDKEGHVGGCKEGHVDGDKEGHVDGDKERHMDGVQGGQGTDVA